jgi:hypothetical protein
MLEMDAQTILWVTAIGVMLLLALGLVFFRRKVVATVAGFSWVRQMFLEKYVWMEESSLVGFPDGSRNQRKTRERYQSFEVVRHDTRTTTDANGNTTTTTQPVSGWVTHWRTRYLYEIQRWITSRQLNTSGEDREPYWPEYVLDESISERVCKTKETYLVHFQNAKGKSFQREMPEDAWAHFDERDTYALKATVFGRITWVEPDQSQPTPGEEQPVMLIQEQKRVL